MTTITDDHVQDAAEAAAPLFHRTVSELELGPAQAERLVLRMVDLYLLGRTAGANQLAQQMNRQLSAEGLDAAILVRHEPVPASVAPLRIPVQVLR